MDKAVTKSFDIAKETFFRYNVCRRIYPVYHGGDAVDPLNTTTVIADDLEIEADRIKFDQSVKRVLANLPILAYTVKFTVTEVMDMTIAEIEAAIVRSSVEVSTVCVNPGLSNSKAVLQNCQDSISSEGTIYYDIRFVINLPDGSQTRIIVNIEAQRKSSPGYSIVKRGIFYAARLISAQLGIEFYNKGEDKTQYDNIKKVYSIWICMDCPKDKKDSVVSYALKPEIMYSGNDKLNIDYPYDLLNVILVHLNNEAGKSSNELIRMMDILLSNMAVHEKKFLLETEFSIPMSVELNKEMIDMCNLSAGVEARGIVIGEARGIEKTRIEMITNMIKENINIEVIAKIAKLSVEQVVEIGKKAAVL